MLDCEEVDQGTAKKLLFRSRGDRRAGAMATVVGSMQRGCRHTQE